ncbi:hypothetical protein [Carnobacterium divergens]|uniref:hypothetical protein n=1 Tax=Carnobacterium divergens TaxID=2748 RepID=UPI0010724F6B|nr:hypothetical protein [Carnobacterium divergens]TFI74596.1 hypothetical protein CKN81_03320 [Carnobacterium divergens]
MTLPTQDTCRKLQQQLTAKKLELRHLKETHLIVEHAFLDSQYFSKKEQYLWEKILQLCSGTSSETSVVNEELEQLKEESRLFQQQLIVGEEELKQIRLKTLFELQQLEKNYIQFRNEVQI